MKKKQMMEVLRQHGFCSGRLISMSKSGYRKNHPDNFVVFNAKVFACRQLLVRGMDVDLTIDAVNLAVAAREIGKNLYVLREHAPHFHWGPGTLPMRQVLCNAVWWTCIRPEEPDVFWTVEAVPRPSTRARLACDTGMWQGSPAYSVNCWDNEACNNQSMVGAVIDLIGCPPKEFYATKIPKGEEFSMPPSQTPGQPVYPIFYQHSGLLEYVWFSNCLAVPALLYDNTVGCLDFLTFTSHKDTSAIHVRQAGKVIGLIWPSVSPLLEAAHSARQQLRLVLDKRVARRQRLSP